MTSRSTLALVSLVSATGASGCYSTWDITPQMLVQLDGFKGAQTAQLETPRQEQVEFTSDTTLRLRGTDGREMEAQFQAIQMNGPILVGQTRDRGQVFVDVSRISSVQVTNLSKGASIGFGVGVAAVGIPISIAAVVVGAFGMFGASFGGGRPLRVAGQTTSERAPLVLGRRTTRTSRTRRTDDATRTRLLAHWAGEASSECASVPAFFALARDLAKASAPTSLVQAALKAAREEITHTALCSALATDYAESTITALLPAVPNAHDIDTTALLERLVLEAFWDGCVAEGAAAAIARRSSATTTDETTRLALHTIAHDEQNHAELARQVIGFGLSAGGRAIQKTLLESFEQRRADEEAALEQMDPAFAGEFDVDTARSYGFAEDTVTHAAREETWDKSRRLIAQLS